MQHPQYIYTLIIDSLDDLIAAERRGPDMLAPLGAQSMDIGTRGDPGAVVQQFIHEAGGASGIVLADKAGNRQQVVSGFGFEPKIHSARAALVSSTTLET